MLTIFSVTCASVDSSGTSLRRGGGGGGVVSRHFFTCERWQLSTLRQLVNEFYQDVNEGSLTRGITRRNRFCTYCYSKEPNNVTAFNLFTFFRADLIQLKVSWKLSSTSDWLMPS